MSFFLALRSSKNRLFMICFSHSFLGSLSDNTASKFQLSGSSVGEIVLQASTKINYNFIVIVKKITTAENAI